MTLLVETRKGVMARRIPPAMPLRLRSKPGRAAEEATHDPAALWGLPDFVFQPALRRLASGTRELGDGTLIVGDLAIVVQVKSREAPSDDPAKEHRWLTKHGTKALRQARGTIRQLHREPATLTNARGRTITVDANQLRWIAAVVIDHHDPPQGVVPFQVPELKDAAVLLRRDWEFLFDQLKSTHAVGSYLERIAGQPVELGSEPIRYYQLAAADAAATPASLDPRFRMAGSLEVSEPQLPMAPAATEDEVSHRLVRSIFEDIATTELRSTTEDQRVRVLAELDQLPVAQRAMIGRYLGEAFDQVSQERRDGVVWHLRRVFGGLGATQLGFGACSQFNDLIQAAFSAWVQLRHHEFTERLSAGSATPVTVGVLLTPRGDGHRPWDTTMSAVAGRIALPAEELAAFVEVWRNEDEVIAQAA